VFPSAIIDDLFQRYFANLKEVVPYCVTAVLTVTLLCVPHIRLRLMRYRNPLRLVILAMACTLALSWGWSLIWASDDAYISFRYAENLAKGNGLVFNPGERVEGYTDYLWTVIAAIGLLCKLDPGQVTIILNLLSFAGLLVLVERLGTRLRASPTLIGLATLLVASNYTIASFSTACIETLFAATLMTWALERVDAGKPLAGGLAGIAATLTHPDHGLMYAVLGFALFVDRKRWREFVWYCVPFFAVFVPYLLWKKHYYGEWLPNTYFAKSANKAYFDQGFAYLLITIIGAGLWLTIPLVAVGAYFTRKSLIGRYSIMVLPVYLGYVAKVGGDFMLGRFFVAALPLWFLLADAGYRYLLSRNHWRAALALAIPASAASLPSSVVKPGEIYHGVADERTFGGVEDFATMKVASSGYAIGQNLNQRLAKRHVLPKIAVWGIGMVGYYSKLPLFDMRGLTSPSVAHLPLERRGRPGHEKVASPGLVVESGSQLSEMAVFPAPFANLTGVNFSGWGLHMTRYDSNLASKLPQGSAPLAFPSYLDSHISALAQQSEPDLMCELWFLKEYYFALNPDASRKQRVTAAALQAVTHLAGSEAVLLETRDLSQLGWLRVKSFNFEPSDPKWTPEGDANEWFASDLRAEQEYPLGRSGRFVNSFVLPSPEASKGRLTSPAFEIDGELLTFKLGGGKMPDSEKLELLVDNQTVRTATGCNSEWLDRRVWNVSAYRGRTARLVITDASTSSWGHVLVDEIEIWKRAG